MTLLREADSPRPPIDLNDQPHHSDTTMESLHFDTHSFVKRLIGAGMPEDQAEILASERSHLVESELVT